MFYLKGPPFRAIRQNWLLTLNTDLFVLFGTSAGITDRKWWKSVCNRLVNSSARLIYFVHCTQKRPHMNLYMEDMRDEVIRKLFESANTSGEAVFDNVIQRCFVSFSDTMFKLPVTYNNRIKQEKTYKLGNTEVTMKVFDMSMRHIAVSVEASGEETGVPAEVMWLKDNFPNYTHNSQHLIPSNSERNDVSFDLLPIHNKTKRKDIYFEISSFLGKNNISLKGLSSQKKVEALRKIL